MRAVSRTPRRTCVTGSRSPCGSAARVGCSNAWTAAGTCAPRPGGPPRPSRSGPRMPRSCRHDGGVDTPAVVRRREEPLRAARQALGPDRTRAAEDRGAAMSLATAAEYALMLTAPPRSRPRRRDWRTSAPGNGSWSPWSPRAAPTPRSPPQLYISIRTVRSHLDRIRDKTGCRRRADLTRLALARAWSNQGRSAGGRAQPAAPVGSFPPAAAAAAKG